MASGSGNWQVFSFIGVSQLRCVGYGYLDPAYRPVLLTGVGCPCTYGVCWSCLEGLTMGRMMMGRMRMDWTSDLEPEQMLFKFLLSQQQ